MAVRFASTGRDVLIRNDLNDMSRQYWLVDAKTKRPIAMPFTDLRAAIAAALEASQGGAIWQENVDARGRSMGPPILLGVSGTACLRR
jgi:hypothetical protein